MPRLHSQLRRRIQVQLGVSMLVVAGMLACLAALSLFAGFVITRSPRGSPGGWPLPTSDASTVIVIERGRVLFTSRVAGYEDDLPPTQFAWQFHRLGHDASVRSFDAPRWLWLIGVDWHLSRVTIPLTTPYTWRDLAVSIPLWAVIGVLAPGGWLLTWRNRIERRRVRNGQCPACGYDCRMTPQRCPECGFTDVIASA